MLRRPVPKDGDDVSGAHTFGHELLTAEQIRRLADFATYWAVMLHMESDDQEPKQSMFPSDGLVNIFEQGKLCRATLIAGFRISRQPQRPVPGCFFRTLDFLLQFIAGGNIYRPINEKEDVKGFPPAGWCRPPVVTAADDAAAAMTALLSGTTSDCLARAPATDPIRLFYSSRTWCLVQCYHITASTVRMRIGMLPEEVYQMYCDGMLSDYAMVVGLTDPAPPTNLWVPPCVMMPLGALLYMHGHGRPYLPLSLTELWDVRNSGIQALGPRKAAEPLPLPYGIWPAALEGEEQQEAPAPPDPKPKGVPPPPGMDFGPAPVRGAGGADGRAGAGGGSGTGSRQMSRAGSAAPGSSGAGGASGSGGASARPGGGGAASDGSTAAAAAAPPPPALKLDPILDSANWIMPKPFDAPVTSQTPPPAPEAVSAATDPIATAEAEQAPAHALVALPPSQFFAVHNNGVQSTFETPAFQLFLGVRCQTALSSNWWFIDSETKGIRGPYSPEQMTLSYFAGCRELLEETPICGTEADVRPPMLPPPNAFQPLDSLLQAMNDGGTYRLVTRADILSPLAQHLLGSRIQKPPAAPVMVPVQAMTAMPVTAPVVLAVQRAQQQVAQTVVAAVSAGSSTAIPTPAAAPAPTVSALPVLVAVQAAAQPVAKLQAQPQPPQQSQHQQALTGVVTTTPAAAPTQPMFRPMVPLAHMAGAGALPRPLLAPSSTAATPAFFMPGTMAYMQHHGHQHAAPFTASAVLAQPVLGGAAVSAMDATPHLHKPQQQQ